MATFTMIRNSITQDFTYVVPASAIQFMNYVKAFFLFRGWNFVKVSQTP